MSKTVTNLKKHTADNLVLWVKFHNLHWNVRGPQFKAVHEMTEAYYDAIAEDYDALAERLVQLGEKPPVTTAECTALSSVKEVAKNGFTVAEVLDIVKADFTALVDEYHAARTEAAESGDSTTEAIYVDMVARLEKQLWMIDATIG